MKLSLQWLNEFVEIKDFFSCPEKLADQLNSSGIEVESIEDQGRKYQHVVVGEIKEKGSHPHADRLTLCQVDVGDGTLKQIVCGAKNHQKGDRVVVALPGAILPGDFAIKISRIRQVESQGMLCSEVELGLALESEGIMILPSSAPIGQTFAQYRGEEDILFDVSVTPNRADCLSHMGLAREIAALLGRKWSFPHSPMSPDGRSTRESLSLEVKDPVLCPRYAGRMVWGVTVGPSPDWLKLRLEKLGIHSINNVVDITNYVLLELGQPLHAFDLSELSNQKIVVDKAKREESFVSLDGTQCKLTGEELTIRDGKRPVALAGVIGGKNSGVRPETRDVFIESAYFNRECVRKTSRKWGIETESSYRFSRGIDPEGIILALNRACQLMADIAGGTVSKDFLEVYPQPIKPSPILVSHDYLETRLGTSIPEKLWEMWMNRIGCQVQGDKQKGWQILPPVYRWDLEMPVDLLEEYARLSGYDQIPETFPFLQQEPMSHDRNYVIENQLNEKLVTEGYHQVFNFAFMGSKQKEYWLKNPKELNNLGLETPTIGIGIKNPLSEETSEMRISLIPGLGKNLIHNLRQGLSVGRIFETGSVFSPSGEGNYKEELRTALMGWGQNLDLWNKPNDYLAVIFSLKSSVENWLKRLGLYRFQWRKVVPEKVPGFMHPQQCLTLEFEGQALGFLGTLHPTLIQEQKIRVSVALGEFSTQKLIDRLKRAEVAQVQKIKSFSYFPSVERDLAFLVPQNVEAAAVSQVMIKELQRMGKSSWLEELKLFDVYSNEHLASDKNETMRSITYKLVFRDQQGTLQEPQLTELQSQLIEAVKKQLQIQVR